MDRQKSVAYSSELDRETLVKDKKILLKKYSCKVRNNEILYFSEHILLNFSNCSRMMYRLETKKK